MQNPLDEQWRAVKSILRYLEGTIEHELTLRNCTNSKVLQMLVGQLTQIIIDQHLVIAVTLERIQCHDVLKRKHPSQDLALKLNTGVSQMKQWSNVDKIIVK